MILRTLLLVLLAGAGLAHAQQYRWVDKDGVVQYTDTLPPPGAKDVQKLKPRSANVAQPQTPFALANVQKDFPVTLYTSPNCKEPCSAAREALNKRGVPFKEVQVWDPDTNKQLEKVAGSSGVPTLVVGRTVQKGYEQGAYDILLDSAGYPRAGILPVGTQGVPAPPEGYVPPTEREKSVAEPVKPEAEEQPLGPYAPGAPAQQRRPRR